MIEINVCIGSACHLKGAYNVINNLKKLIEEKNLEDKIEIKAAFCLGQCTNAVSVRINDEPIVSVNEDEVDKFFERHLAGRV
ncbi:(2Fe-2S) ferredoxin domain-containing protein [Paramaledivibacter caminithermalis]|jgi:NADH:ubiquinone oxidoreductase subunit E|uniref:Thioredoxin-like [2Fe-2S] ferredoxin n=1 Tax=Paramaledivibacter caminithermalis (strain DSM 15212 / CIP 107654 / DViRD3) TaxID=1121301 RepID=A0A1M6TKE8_PARC5|nr:(2Fe-2S) ferredoxin domain-containing protein [Paramaledivibacter caminithermalis]SHK57383.1 Thioredoxin-like [2Fe-2S] ferredoxin [Paramaledivibacter caminithermalis DSM 15212]